MYISSRCKRQEGITSRRSFNMDLKLLKILLSTPLAYM